MCKSWKVVGICGVTNGGKTRLARLLAKLLSNVEIISQDAYFLPENSSKHILIPELNHINWELLSSLDMEQMCADVNKIIKNEKVIIKQLQEESTEDFTSYTNLVSIEDLQALKKKLNSYNILLIEGFSIFNYEPIEKMCDLKFYITLEKEICYFRRLQRSYNPPDVPGYFEKVVWPEHQKQLKEVQEKCKNVIYLTQDNDNHLGTVINYLLTL